MKNISINLNQKIYSKIAYLASIKKVSITNFLTPILEDLVKDIEIPECSPRLQKADIKENFTFENKQQNQSLKDTVCNKDNISLEVIGNHFANYMVQKYHYLHRKIYIGRNISYSIKHSQLEDIGIIMFGYPIFHKNKHLVGQR